MAQKLLNILAGEFPETNKFSERISKPKPKENLLDIFPIIFWI